MLLNHPQMSPLKRNGAQVGKQDMCVSIIVPFEDLLLFLSGKENVSTCHIERGNVKYTKMTSDRFVHPFR